MNGGDGSHGNRIFGADGHRSIVGADQGCTSDARRGVEPVSDHVQGILNPQRSGRESRQRGDPDEGKQRDPGKSYRLLTDQVLGQPTP